MEFFFGLRFLNLPTDATNSSAFKPVVVEVSRRCGIRSR